MRARLLLATLIIFAFMLVSGCWDAQQLNDLAIVDSVAIDQAQEPGKVELTAAIIRRPAFQRNATLPESAEKVAIFSSTGYTVFDAVRNFTLQSGEKLFWGHADAIIFGEALARSGVLPWMDFFLRDVEPRMRARVYVVKDRAAKDLLSIRPRIVGTPGRHLTDLTDVEPFATKGIAITLRQFSLDLSNSFAGALAARVDLLNSKPQPIAQPESLLMGPTEQRQRESVRVFGGAVFNKGRLVGWFDAREARGLRWIQGEAKRGSLLVTCPAHDDQFAALEMFESSSKPRMTKSKGQLRIQLAVAVEARLTDQMCAEDLSTLEAQESLERRATEVVKNDILDALNMGKEVLQTDVFGFSSLVERTYPNDWRQIKDHWDSIFSVMPVDINVKVEIRRTGRTLEPLAAERKEQ